MGPKEAVFQVTKEAGGVRKAESLSDLPRGPRQSYYRNQVKKAPLPTYLRGKEKDDELLEVVLNMKTEEEPSSRTNCRKGQPDHRYCNRQSIARVGEVQHIGVRFLHCSARSDIQSRV